MTEAEQEINLIIGSYLKMKKHLLKLKEWLNILAFIIIIAMLISVFVLMIMYVLFPSAIEYGISVGRNL